VVQLGLPRLLNNPAAMKLNVLNASECWAVWSELLQDPRIHHVVDEPPDLDIVFQRFTGNRAYVPRLWTDAYLAAFALSCDATLVTFDRGFLQYPDLRAFVLS
jgi:predicted nucleic acid-binding protein